MKSDAPPPSAINPFPSIRIHMTEEGSNKKLVTLKMDPTETVENLIAKICTEFSCCPNQFHLLFNGMVLQVERNLRNYSIKEGSLRLFDRSTSEMHCTSDPNLSDRSKSSGISPSLSATGGR
jgi:hypothetical protein